ncbi:MAG: enoyl-CoA hydratase-related protein [Halapricum sp.]
MGVVVRKQCLELLLTGESIDADTAHKCGLISGVPPAGEHVEAAVEYAGTITSKHPTAIQCGKRAYYKMTGRGYADALEYSNEQFAGQCTTADAEAGIEAFLEGDPLESVPRPVPKPHGCDGTRETAENGRQNGFMSP